MPLDHARPFCSAGDSLRYSSCAVQVAAAALTEKGKSEALEREYKVRATTNEMLPEAGRFIAELKEICASRFVVS